MKSPVWSESVAETTNTKPLKRPRRSNKPAMERRRRERINGCLEQIKNHVLHAEGKDPARYVKVEKADVLEMTVRFLKSQTAKFGDRHSTANYMTGYRACMANLQQVLKTDKLYFPVEIKEKILQYLDQTLLDKEQQATNVDETKDARYSLDPNGTKNSVTINTSFNGARQRAKIAVNYNTPVLPVNTSNLTVYIPPSQTWSPPVANTPSLDHLCSPPSSPESTRTLSPVNSSFTNPLTCSILQPVNPNTGKSSVINYPTSKMNSNHQIEYHNETTKQESISYSSTNNTEYYVLRESKVIKQFKEMQPFQTPPSQSTPTSPHTPSLCTSDSKTKSSSTNLHCLYFAPQSVPLNLAAPKSKQIKAERPEEESQQLVHQSKSVQYPPAALIPSNYPGAAAAADVRIPYPTPHPAHLGPDDSHWRPWFN